MHLLLVEDGEVGDRSFLYVLDDGFPQVLVALHSELPFVKPNLSRGQTQCKQREVLADSEAVSFLQSLEVDEWKLFDHVAFGIPYLADTLLALLVFIDS